MKTKRIEVVLSDEQMRFVEWMAERDNVTVGRELRMMFYTELYQCETLYKPEMESEQ